MPVSSSERAFFVRTDCHSFLFRQLLLLFRIAQLIYP
jgi:hypothetical protein